MTFRTVEPLRLMISSRCSDKVRFQGAQRSLSVVRKAIKKTLEEIQLGGNPVFEVWIHEDESSLPGDQSSWEHCMKKARQADIVLVLYNGNAGWSGNSSRTGDHVGICHAEFQEAFDSCPTKVRSVQFPEIAANAGSPNERFQSYFQKQSILGAQVTTGEEAIAAATEAAVAALLDLARAGVGVNSKGNFYAGEALAWTRLDYQGRREITIRTVVDFLSHRSGTSPTEGQGNTVAYSVSGTMVAFVCDCIPAALSTPAARELVGQPFLKDYVAVEKLPKRVGGPVHLIACQKGVTEAQALRQLGFPDAVVVSAPFGVYVADDIQKIQMVFIANCRDETTTRHHVQRFLTWLDAQGEARRLAQRALSRRKIAELLASEHRSVL
ncbi:MAG: hypothetical protein KDA85_03560 [Planctomycetaceae bacterium]|nr:hypothetical protein [Planctomycetaceae bacterium]